MIVFFRNSLSFALVLCFSSPVFAFEISALASTPPEALKPKHREWLAITRPVHEKMATFALSCAENKDGDDVCHSDSLNGAANHINQENPLIRGSRWNDDPNGFLVSKRETVRWQWAFWLTDAKDKVTRGKTINGIYPVMYRSHYGDLQILHAMAPRGTSPTEAQNQVLSWVKFAYLVANKTIKPNWKLVGPQVKKETPLFSSMFRGIRNKAPWTVRDLFTNYRDKPSANAATYSDDYLAEMALGALLHTVQDSFSNSHTQREHLGQPDTAASGNIIQFHDYETQVSSCHGKEDVLPNWLANDIEIQMNPIQIGAWIIKHATNQEPWDGAVETYFRDTVFAISDKATPSGAGPYGRGNEQCSPWNNSAFLQGG